MTVSNISKKWKPFNDLVVEKYIQGMRPAEIAKLYRRSVPFINKIVESEEFKHRFEDKISFHRTTTYNPMDLLATYKTELIKAKLDLAFNGIKESVRSEAISWLLERFPEFKTAMQSISQNTYVLTREESDLNKKTIEKMMDILKLAKDATIPLDTVKSEAKLIESDPKPCEGTQECPTDDRTASTPSQTA